MLGIEGSQTKMYFQFQRQQLQQQKQKSKNIYTIYMCILYNCLQRNHRFSLITFFKYLY